VAARDSQQAVRLYTRIVEPSVHSLVLGRQQQNSSSVHQQVAATVCDLMIRLSNFDVC